MDILLRKAFKHISKDCDICDRQLSKEILDDEIFEKGHAATNKILNKYMFPEVIHEGLICNECAMKPIRGNRYFCLTCSAFDLCEDCGDVNFHDHPLLLTSSKFVSHLIKFRNPFKRYF